jgi:two-component system, OmpR family, phosphate regulon sensor histidine kinase PhoR
VALEDTRLNLQSPWSRFSAVALERIQHRAEMLTVIAIGISALVVLTALDWASGLLTLISALLYVVLRPEAPTAEQIASSTLASDLRDVSAERQAIVAAIPDPAWVLDGNGVVLHVNASARAMFPSLRTGAHVSSAVRSPDVIEAVDRAVATGVVQTASLHERVPIERRLSVVVAPMLLPSGQATDASLLLTLRDLTEQDRLAQMRADFVANASHELRTPLASLRGFVETLQGPARNDPAARERFLRIMSTQADRMTRLIDDLLSLSRVEMREHVAPTAFVDLVAVAHHAIQGLEPQATEGRIALELDAQSRPMLVRGDRDELLQVMQNLIQNAIKYGREGGRVDVRLRRRAGIGGKSSRIAVEVSDNGPGIAAEHIPRLTERFYRVNALQSRDKGGTGLGLAIVKHIVSRHSGELQIASEVGVGSAFTFILTETTTPQ